MRVIYTLASCFQNIAQPSSVSDEVAFDGSSATSNKINSDNNKPELAVPFDFVVKPPKRVSLPVVASNLVFHNPAGT